MGLRCSIGVMLQQDFTEDWDSVGGEGNGIMFLIKKCRCNFMTSKMGSNLRLLNFALLRLLGAL